MAKKARSSPIPTRFDADDVALLDSLAGKHHLDRSFIIAAAVRAALARAKEGDVRWLLDPSPDSATHLRDENPVLAEIRERLARLEEGTTPQSVHFGSKKKAG